MDGKPKLNQDRKIRETYFAKNWIISCFVLWLHGCFDSWRFLTATSALKPTLASCLTRLFRILIIRTYFKKCGPLSHFDMLIISQKRFCALVRICSMSILRTVQHAFQNGIKQPMTSYEILDRLKGMVHKKLKWGVVKLHHCIVWSWGIAWK